MRRAFQFRQWLALICVAVLLWAVLDASAYAPVLPAPLWLLFELVVLVFAFAARNGDRRRLDSFLPNVPSRAPPAA